MEEEDEVTHIDRLPAEVLDYILTLVSPYNDLQACKLVCKRWLDIVQGFLKHFNFFCS